MHFEVVPPAQRWVILNKPNWDTNQVHVRAAASESTNKMLLPWFLLLSTGCYCNDTVTCKEKKNLAFFHPSGVGKEENTSLSCACKSLRRNEMLKRGRIDQQMAWISAMVSSPLL